MNTLQGPVRENATSAATPRSLLDRIRSGIHPAHRKQIIQRYLTESRRFLTDEGLTDISALEIDEKSLFPPKGTKSGSLASTVEAGLAYLGKKRASSRLSLVAEGLTRGYHIVVDMSFRRRQFTSQPTLTVSVSAFPVAAPKLGSPPKGRAVRRLVCEGNESAVGKEKQRALSTHG